MWERRWAQAADRQQVCWAQVLDPTRPAARMAALPLVWRWKVGMVAAAGGCLDRWGCGQWGQQQWRRRWVGGCRLAAPAQPRLHLCHVVSPLLSRLARAPTLEHKSTVKSLPAARRASPAGDQISATRSRTVVGVNSAPRRLELPPAARLAPPSTWPTMTSEPLCAPWHTLTPLSDKQISKTQHSDDNSMPLRAQASGPRWPARQRPAAAAR